MKIDLANVAAAGAFVLVLAVIVARVNNGASPNSFAGKILGKT